MSVRQLDNDNPTIFAPSAASSSRRKTGKALLWDEEAEGYAEYDGESSGEEQREVIDAEEVFGESIVCG
jgi:hypothetical protein